MPPRTRSQNKAAPANLVEEASGVVSTPEPADPAPLTPRVEETPEAVPASEPADPAPLTPPAEPGTADDEPITDAAPLTPPTKREKAPEVKQDPMTPPPPPPAVGQQGTLDLRWSNGEQVTDADDLFEDPGARYTHMIVKRRVLERHYYDGANTPTNRLLYAVGARVPRSEADRIRRELSSS
ncbi:hypothetical protein ACQP2T_61010 [Nonomuraea sp. CA-143628]|uniref:hypothetical protein n=1 Tax=Nonomuraea sp. CA-143628 TaxID=3239997 RepID=UPI003D8FB6F6